MENKKRKQGVFTKILCALLSVVLFIALTVSTVLTVFREALSGDFVETIVNEIDLSEIDFGTPKDEAGALYIDGTDLKVERLSEVSTPTDAITALENTELQSVLDAIGSEDAENAINELLENPEASGNKTLADMAYDLCLEFGYDEVDPEKLAEVINGPLVKDFITETIEDYKDYIIDGGEDSTGLTAEKIVDYIKEKEEEIKEAFSYIGIEEEIEINYDELEREIEATIGDELPVDNLVTIAPDAVKAVRAIISRETLLILWGIVGALSLIILLLCINTISNALIFIGIPTGLLGGLMVLVATRIKPLLSSYQDNSFFDASMIAFPTVFKFGIILGVAGILMLALKIIVIAVKRRKAK